MKWAAGEGHPSRETGRERKRKKVLLRECFPSPGIAALPPFIVIAFFFCVILLCMMEKNLTIGVMILLHWGWANLTPVEYDSTT
jgi:hypothetical protein